jgi:putative ABC transport system ATP-binding protein
MPVKSRTRKPLPERLPPYRAEDKKFIRILQLSKGYQEGKAFHSILKDVDVDISQGEFIAILGKSGSGKSTLLNLISGIDQVDEGEIWFQNQKLTDFDELQRTLFRRKNIGFIFQFFNLIPTLTVWENVILPLELEGKGNPDGFQKAESLLAEVGLLDRKDAFPDLLSGGEQQRVAIARALVHDSLLDRLTRQAGKNLILVTHSQEAANYADWIYYLRDGKLKGL